GKYGEQLPQNPSLSFTLKHSKTITRIEYQKKRKELPLLEYYFEQKQNIEFEDKVRKYLDRISIYIPFIKSLDLLIYSQNTFPHSAGIASSASAYSALALCLCSIENELFGRLSDAPSFFQKASFLARLGSGSACRSTYGDLVLWGETKSVKGSSNEFAIELRGEVNSVFKNYFDAILIIDSGKKELSSTLGHGLMQNHPFATVRYEQANQNLDKITESLKLGDEQGFAQVVENEAMTLHALLLSSVPSVSLLKPNTLKALERLKAFRTSSRLNFTFTLDAGANIHILYKASIREQMVNFITNSLTELCENGLWIDDEISTGPNKL
ncbi:MAG TPA: diphosphomevalonate decarboxylase, partial [Bacteroidales bacterium]|nr:diphosphomevalonate decarboxylase [Bacteroidales bacterium]